MQTTMEPGAANETLRGSFKRDGYVVVRGFLDPDALAELRAELARYIRDVVPTLPDSHAFYLDKSRPETLKQLQHMGCDPYFAEIWKRPSWLALVESLLGESVQPAEPEWFNKPPRSESPTPPHQDNYYFCLRPPSVLTLWIALEPVDEENGCLRYLPGSHREGIRPHGASRILGFSQGIREYTAEDAAREVPIRLGSGDAVLHHGNMIHRADPNGSETRSRSAFAVVYRGVSATRDAAAFERYQTELRRQHEALGLQVDPNAAV